MITFALGLIAFWVIIIFLVVPVIYLMVFTLVAMFSYFDSYPKEQPIKHKFQYSVIKRKKRQPEDFDKVLFGG